MKSDKKTTIIKNNSGWCVCNHCKAVLKTGRARKFCDKSCNDEFDSAIKRAKTANKRKKIHNTINPRAPFTYYLAKQCIRAKTLDIVAGISMEELEALYSLWKDCGHFNGWGDNKTDPYELSHIVPVKHPSVIGLLRADNLVIAPRSFNRALGAKTFSLEAGRYISRTSLNISNMVFEHEKEADVATRLINVIGKELFTDFAIKVKLKAATRYKHIDTLEKLLDLSNKEHNKIWNDALSGKTTTPELGKIIASLKGKDVSAFSFSASSIDYVLKSEIIRLSAFRADVAELAASLTLECDTASIDAEFKASQLENRYSHSHYRQYMEARESVFAGHSETLARLKTNSDEILRKLHGEGFAAASVVTQSEAEFDVFANIVISTRAAASVMKETHEGQVGTTVTNLEESTPTLTRATAILDVINACSGTTDIRVTHQSEALRESPYQRELIAF
jgi:hypothetical protein